MNFIDFGRNDDDNDQEFQIQQCGDYEEPQKSDSEQQDYIVGPYVIGDIDDIDDQNEENKNNEEQISDHHDNQFQKESDNPFQAHQKVKQSYGEEEKEEEVKQNYQEEIIEQQLLQSQEVQTYFVGEDKQEKLIFDNEDVQFGTIIDMEDATHQIRQGDNENQTNFSTNRVEIVKQNEQNTRRPNNVDQQQRANQVIGIRQTAEQNYLNEIDYYDQHGFFKLKDFYRQLQNVKHFEKSKSYISIVKFLEYSDEGKEYIVFSNGLAESEKNTSVQDILIGRQRDVMEGDIRKIPNDITEDDSDMSRIHCKLITKHYFNKQQVLDGGYRDFEKIMSLIYKRYQKKKKEGDLQDLEQYQTIYKIAEQITRLDPFLHRLKKFIVPERCVYAVDIGSQNGTKIEIKTEEFTPISSKMIISIGSNTLLLVDQVNDIKYYDSAFEELVANVVYDQCRMDFEKDYYNIEYEVTTIVQGLFLKKDRVYAAFQAILKEFRESLGNRNQQENTLFNQYEKPRYVQRCLDIIRKYRIKNNWKDLFTTFQPYLRILVKFDDKSRITVRPYYLFHNPNDVRPFLIGRMDDCDIQIKYSFISRHNTEIVYKNNRWFARDGIEFGDKRSPSSLGTWVDLTNFESSLPASYITSGLKCVFEPRVQREEIGPYPIRNGDTLKCGRQKYTIWYHPDENEFLPPSDSQNKPQTEGQPENNQTELSDDITHRKGQKEGQKEEEN